MIQDSRIRQLFELKKSIDISFYELSRFGLMINYTQNGDSKSIQKGIRGTCLLLKGAGLIKEVTGSDWVAWETETNTERNGEHYQECKTCYGSFKDFVEQTRFSLNDANEVVAFYILNNQKIPA